MKKATMSAKPTYLGLLNAITVGEARGYRLLSAWAGKTNNRGLATVLNFVAIRENEHAAAFEKRLCELGYTVRKTASEKFDAHLEYVNSDVSDSDKFAKVLGLEGELASSEDTSRPDPFANLFADESIDPQTGALLGRYIAEERDSGRRLTDACNKLHVASDNNQDDELLLQGIAERLDRLTATIEKFKAARQ